MIGSGKDTVADYLVEKHGFVRASFAKWVKDAVAVIFGWDREMLEGRTPESREWRDQIDEWWSQELDMEITPRGVLQQFGTEIMRNGFHQDIWVLAAKRWIAQNRDKKIVFTDTRFLNELAMLRGENAILVGIYRKQPKWLEEFYQRVDNLVLTDQTCGFQELDMSRPSQRLYLSSVADMAMLEMRLGIHRSEYEHLVWPNYDVLIDNTKSFTNTYEQIEKLLR